MNERWTREKSDYHQIPELSSHRGFRLEGEDGKRVLVYGHDCSEVEGERLNVGVAVMQQESRDQRLKPEDFSDHDVLSVGWCDRARPPLD